MSLFIGNTAPSKIYVGDTPVSKVFVGDTQVRPSGWQPGANTIAYYPLNSTTTTNDMKGRGTAYNLSTAGNPTFVTKGGVSCAYTDGVDDAFTQNSITTNLIGNEFTCLYWSYLESGDTGAGVSTLLYSGGKFWGWYVGNSTSSISSEVLNGSQNILSKSLTIPTNTRNLICITHNSSSITTLYYNGALQATKTQALGLKNTHFVIGASNYTGTLEYYNKGAISNVILEDKARTAEEVSDYYNQTKDIYIPQLKTSAEIISMANAEQYSRTNTIAELNTYPSEYYTQLSTDGKLQSFRYSGNSGYYIKDTKVGARMFSAVYYDGSVWTSGYVGDNAG